MDQGRFQEAQKAYEAGDFRSAAKGFLASAGKGAEGNGAAYHMAGNALMRLRRYRDATTVYSHALRDPVYDRRGAVQANLGQAYAALGEYPEAVAAFDAALAEPDYTTRWRALQGKAGALLEMGRAEEAAAAYRAAAIDEQNPDAGRALVNLGLCFMALGRPADAAEAYKAALGFDNYTGRGKALANLGQAFVAMGEYDEAVRAFERAVELHDHKLSPAAQEAYDLAVARARPAREVVEGWSTGEMPPAFDTPEGGDIESTAGSGQGFAGEPEGWSTGELRALTGVSSPSSAPDGAVRQADAVGADEAELAAARLGLGDEEAVEAFFSRTEGEMLERDRDARRAARMELDESRSVWVTVALAAAAVAVIVGVAVGAWYLGLGWPTQGQSVKGLLNAHANGGDVERYWVAVPAADVAKEMAKIPAIESYSVDSVERSPATSTVEVTVVPQKGAPLHYTVTLGREGVGWKVTGIENAWRSTGGS